MKQAGHIYRGLRPSAGRRGACLKDGKHIDKSQSTQSLDGTCGDESESA